LLKSVDDSLKSKPKQFLKYVSNVKGKDNNCIQIKVDGQSVTKNKISANAFVNHFKSIFNTSCRTVTLPYTVTTGFLPTALISAGEVSWAIKRLKQPKCVCLDGIP
jgi:hypothetical protein